MRNTCYRHYPKKIDDIEDGELIEVIPPEPEREGYTFNGWYKEAECINKWEFETDRVEKKAMLSFYEYPDDYITFLYAGWSSNI